MALAVFNRRMARINRNIYKGLANYTAGLENVLSGMRVVKAFANESHEQQLFEELIQEYRSNKIAVLSYEWGQAVVSTTFINAQY